MHHTLRTAECTTETGHGCARPEQVLKAILVTCKSWCQVCALSALLWQSLKTSSEYKVPQVNGLDVLYVCRVAAVEAPTEAELLASMKDLSYSDQYDIFFGNNIDKKKVCH